MDPIHNSLINGFLICSTIDVKEGDSSSDVPGVF